MTKKNLLTKVAICSSMLFAISCSSNFDSKQNDTGKSAEVQLLEQLKLESEKQTKLSAESIQRNEIAKQLIVEKLNDPATSEEDRARYEAQLEILNSLGDKVDSLGTDDVPVVASEGAEDVTGAVTDADVTNSDEVAAEVIEDAIEDQNGEVELDKLEEEIILVYDESRNEFKFSHKDNVEGVEYSVLAALSALKDNQIVEVPVFKDGIPVVGYTSKISCEGDEDSLCEQVTVVTTRVNSDESVIVRRLIFKAENNAYVLKINLNSDQATPTHADPANEAVAPEVSAPEVITTEVLPEVSTVDHSDGNNHPLNQIENAPSTEDAPSVETGHPAHF